MVRSKTIHEVLAITTGAVFVLAASEAAVAQSLLWTYPEPLNNNAAGDVGDDYQPDLTTDGNGNWVATWVSTEELDPPGPNIGTDLDVLVARSTDDGLTWTDPAPLNNNAAGDAGNDNGPQVTTDGLGLWVAVWASNEDLDPPGIDPPIGTDFDILWAYSTDNGDNWSDPKPLNNNAATDAGDDYSPQVTTDGMGNWVVVWESYETLAGTIGTDLDILVAHSTNNGQTWSDLAPLNNAAMDAGDDRHAQVTTDRAGNWGAVWESYDSIGGTIGTDGDILWARSIDNGLTWTVPVQLNNNADGDFGGDHSPQLTTDHTGKWVAVWESYDSLGGTIGIDADILWASSIDNGPWTDPEPLNNNADTDLGHDNEAQLTTDGTGNWVAVWRSDESLGGIGTDQDILVALISDDDLPWTDPEPVNGNAETDAGDDRTPQLTTDGGGNWVAMWRSDDSLAGTIDTDLDILMARGQLDGSPIPTVSEWGLIVMSLLVLTAGTLVYARRRPIHA